MADLREDVRRLCEYLVRNDLDGKASADDILNTMLAEDLYWAIELERMNKESVVIPEELIDPFNCFRREGRLAERARIAFGLRWLGVWYREGHDPDYGSEADTADEAFEDTAAMLEGTYDGR